MNEITLLLLPYVVKLGMKYHLQPGIEIILLNPGIKWLLQPGNDILLVASHTVGEGEAQKMKRKENSPKIWKEEKNPSRAL